MSGRYRAGLRFLSIGTTIVACAIVTSPAYAGCHSFEVSADETVREGDTLTVTVTRDGAVAESSVDLIVVDGTASRGQDLDADRRTTASFPDGGTSQRFTIRILDDTEAEGDETFRLRLGDPRGCSVNPNYALGQDAVVTIRSNDRAAASPSPTATSTPTATTTPVRSTDDAGGGVPIGLIALGVVVVLGGAWALLRARRPSAGSPR